MAFLLHDDEGAESVKTQADIQKLRELVELVDGKTRELHARLSFLVDELSAGGRDRQNLPFFLAMIDESESAVAFWTAEIKEEAQR